MPYTALHFQVLSLPTFLIAPVLFVPLISLPFGFGPLVTFSVVSLCFVPCTCSISLSSSASTFLLVYSRFWQFLHMVLSSVLVFFFFCVYFLDYEHDFLIRITLYFVALSLYVLSHFTLPVLVLFLTFLVHISPFLSVLPVCCIDMHAFIPAFPSVSFQKLVFFELCILP